MKSLMDNELISFTTRPIRKGEIDGRDYHFISVGEYYEMLNNDKLVECTKYGGNYYGLTREELYSKLSQGHAFAIVDHNGAKQLSDIYDYCVTIILHTSKKDAIRQMVERGDDTESIQKRISTYEEEIRNKKYYDYAVVNRYGQFEKTKEIIKNIIAVETRQ